MDAAGGEKGEGCCGSAFGVEAWRGDLKETEGGREAIHILAGERPDSFGRLNGELRTAILVDIPCHIESPLRVITHANLGNKSIPFRARGLRLRPTLQQARRLNRRLRNQATHVNFAEGGCLLREETHVGNCWRHVEVKEKGFKIKGFVAQRRGIPVESDVLDTGELDGVAACCVAWLPQRLANRLFHTIKNSKALGKCLYASRGKGEGVCG